MNKTMRELAEGVEKLTRRNTKANKVTGCRVTPNKLNRGNAAPVLWIPPTTSKFNSALKMLNIDDIRDLSGLCIDTESNIATRIDGLGKAIVVYIAENGGDSKFTHFRWVIGDDPNHPRSLNHAQIAMCNLNNQPIAVYKWQAEGSPKTNEDYKREYENMTKMFACFIISATEEFVKKASAATPHIKPENNQPKSEEVKIDTIIDPPADKISGYDTDTEVEGTAPTSIITTSVNDVIDVDDNEIKPIVEIEESDEEKNKIDFESADLETLLDEHEKIYPDYRLKSWIKTLTNVKKKDFSKDDVFMTKLRNVVKNPIPKTKYFEMGPDNYYRTVGCGY